MSGTLFHPNQGTGEIHIPYNWSYADATARSAAMGFASGDVGKLARQLSDNTLWMLTATTPTWVALGSAPGSYYAPGGTDVAVADGGTGASTAGAARTNLGLGTAATKDVAASGDAASGEVVKGSDTRLIDSRVPTTHAASHAAVGSDPVAIAASQVTSGVLAVARIASGTPDGTKFVRDDGTLAVPAGGSTNPMTTVDDLIIGGTSGAATRLGKGTDGQVLTVDPTTHHLVWAAPASGFADPTTTKGDLIVHGSSTTRVGVGTNGQVLTADSVQTAGLKWADAPGGLSAQLARTIVGAGGVASVAISLSLTGYDSILIMMLLRAVTTSADQDVWCQINGDTASNYGYSITIDSDAQAPTRAFSLNTTSGVHLGGAPKGSRAAGLFASITTEIIGAGLATPHKITRSRGWWADTSNYQALGSNGIWRNTAAITSLLIYLGTGNIEQDSLIEVYGVKG